MLPRVGIMVLISLLMILATTYNGLILGQTYNQVNRLIRINQLSTQFLQRQLA